MAHLALALLGPFQATLDGQPVEGLNSYHLRALLAYLAVDSRREHSREQVASLLWSERPDREALSALRYALSNLRQVLGERRSPGEGESCVPFLLVTRTHVQFNPANDHWLDVAEFQDLRDSSDVADLERAAALYRGPFLDGFSLADSPAFEEWVLLKSEEIQRNLLLLLDCPPFGGLHVRIPRDLHVARLAPRIGGAGADGRVTPILPRRRTNRRKPFACSTH